MATLLDSLQTFGREVPGFMSTSVVHLGDGTNVGAFATQEGFDPEATDAYFTEMLLRHHRAMQALGLPGATEDILTTSQDAFFLARPLPNTNYFWVLTTSRAGNLGFSRAVMRKYHDQIMDALP